MAHHCPLTNGKTLNVFKLIVYCEENLPVRRVAIDKIKEVYRSKRSGFQMKRLLNADFSFPIIVLDDMVLIDGRHRVLKAKASGRKFLQAYIVTERILNLKSLQVKN